jgi:repressor LexA
MITPIQQKIFNFIHDFIKENGYAPLLKEVALGIGISPKSKSFISRSVRDLVDAGFLVVEDQRRPRNIHLVETPRMCLPIMGRIAAGAPIEAISQTDTLDIGALLMHEDHYILEVRGDSMIEEGILDGDKIICKRRDTAKEGDIVVALIDNQEATLKRIRYKPTDNITLLPANPKLKPQVYAAHRVKVQGVFVGLLRFHTQM